MEASKSNPFTPLIFLAVLCLDKELGFVIDNSTLIGVELSDMGKRGRELLFFLCESLSILRVIDHLYLETKRVFLLGWLQHESMAPCHKWNVSNGRIPFPQVPLFPILITFKRPNFIESSTQDL
jgi:hypothetical protein